MFKSFIKEKFQIPPNELDDLLYKTPVIVNNDVKKNLKVERDIIQGDLHLEILRLLNLEWNEKRVEPEFVFRVTDKIFKIQEKLLIFCKYYCMNLFENPPFATSTPYIKLPLNFLCQYLPHIRPYHL